MRRRSVLIIGGSGFVGTHLATRLRDECKVFTTHFRHHQRLAGVTSLPMPLHKRDAIKSIVLATQPDSIVYLAGTPASASATEQELIHSSGALTVLTSSQILGSKFVYLSGVEVFDGTKGSYRGTDRPIARDGRGRARLAAENGIQNRAVHYAIIRSSPAYGIGPFRNPSWTDRLIRDLVRGMPVELDGADIQSFTPVETLVELLARASMDDEVQGIVHHAGADACTELDLGKRIAERLGLPGKHLVPRPRTTRELGDYTLDASRSAAILEMKPLLLEQGLDLLQKQLLVSRA